MSQNQATVAYPPPLAPPPAGYPTKEGETHLQNNVPVETKSRGDGFLKGCLGALCCCCALDACF